MKHSLLILISFILLSSPVIGQSERPETIIVPVSSLGDVSEVRKQILQNTLTDELKKHFRIVPQEKYEQVLEQVFQELEYEECSEDTCIMRIQEILQVENVFNLQIIGEGKDTQLNLKWITLDEKKNETDVCLGCGTFQLNDKVKGLVEKLVGGKKVVENKVEVKVEKSIVVDKIEKVQKNELFVSVGKSGTILTSSDGTSWTKRTSGTSWSLSGVTYGNGLFVTVGFFGTILTSPDGNSWTKRNSETSMYLRGITYGNYTFVIAGQPNNYTSTDGTTWTKRNSGTSKVLVGVTYGNNTFVTVGYSGTILTSPDGNSWTKRNSGTSEKYSTGTSKVLSGVTYGNNTFVTVGDPGTILTSPEGNSWTKRTSGTSKGLVGVTYGNNTFVTVGDSGTILTSPDGNSWTKRTSGTFEFLTGVTYSQ